MRWWTSLEPASRRTRGRPSRRARSGPAPITSMRAPGKSSSASASVAMPLSMVSGPTNSPPARRLFLLFIRLPAPGAVLDLRRALGLLRALARLLDLQDGDAHGLPGGRFRGLLGGVLGLLAIGAPTEPAGGVQVSGGGCCSTHCSLPFLCVVYLRPASMP